MTVWIVVTQYMDSGIFGAYSTIKRARLAFEHFLAEDKDVTSFEDVDNYYYHFTTVNGEEFSAEILWDTVDMEFKEGMIEE